jgi:hypothetical protein
LEIYRTSTVEEKSQNMGTTPPSADTQETSDHQTAKCVITAPNDSFSKPHVISQTKLLYGILHMKIHSQFFGPNMTPQHQESQIHRKKIRNSSQLSLHKELTTSMF